MKVADVDNHLMDFSDDEYDVDGEQEKSMAEMLDNEGDDNGLDEFFAQLKVFAKLVPKINLIRVNQMFVKHTQVITI